jgi:potassium efflux system protein
VEVNGLWAEVKQINVRATVVQTFDNASVIIPNSEFISQQVTNWSFKDSACAATSRWGWPTGRISTWWKDPAGNRPEKTPGLKYPKPDVLFIDHADSALIFRLRIWVHVDDYWEVPSKIRFDIDHRFRASANWASRFAFPQRDAPAMHSSAANRPPFKILND